MIKLDQKWAVVDWALLRIYLITTTALAHPLALAAAVLDDVALRALLELLQIELLLTVAAPVPHGDRLLLVLVGGVFLCAGLGVRQLVLVRVVRGSCSYFGKVLRPCQVALFCVLLLLLRGGTVARGWWWWSERLLFSILLTVVVAVVVVVVVVVRKRGHGQDNL